MKKTKKPKLITYQFTSADGKSQINLLLEKYTLKLTAKISVNSEPIVLEDVFFEADYWLNFFNVDGQHYLILVKEVDLGDSYEVMCYQNGNSLSDDSTIDDLRKKIENPHFGELEYWKKDRKRVFLVSVIVSLLLAIGVVWVFGLNMKKWEKVLVGCGWIVLYWGKKWLDTYIDRKFRKDLLQQLSQNNKND